MDLVVDIEAMREELAGWQGFMRNSIGFWGKPSRFCRGKARGFWRAGLSWYWTYRSAGGMEGNATRSIGLRADMDALPILEQNTFEHCSTHRAPCTLAGMMAIPSCCAAAKYLAATRQFQASQFYLSSGGRFGGAKR